MTTASLPLTYTPAPADESRPPSLRLTLEPEYVDVNRNRATLADIDAMLAMARSGASARNRQIARCKWASWAENGDLLCNLSLWVWPSDIDLPYSLTLPPGVTGSRPVRVSEPRDTKRWIAGSGGEIELPWLLEDAAFGWHPNIGVWDAWSRPSSPPRIEQERARLNLTGERGVYGVLTIRGTAVGWRHDLAIRYPTGESDPDAPAISVAGADDFEVTANWEDENGEAREETAAVVIPECVRALLEECPTGTKRVGSIRVRPAPGPQPVTVFYNACNGTVLDIRRG